jgi:hypothetical protein
LANVLSYINPYGLRPETLICPPGKANNTCISREALLASMKAALFPPEGTTVISYWPDGDKTSAKDEL